MFESKCLEKMFSVAAYGVAWALSEVDGLEQTANGFELDGKAVEFQTPKKDIADGYVVRETKSSIVIEASSATGAIGAVLSISENTRCANAISKKQAIPFKTRFFKHEITFDERTKPDPTLPTVVSYTEEFAEIHLNICGEL